MGNSGVTGSLIGQLGVATAVLLAVVAGSSPTHAQDRAQPGVRVEVVTDDRTLRVDLVDIVTPVGAVELELGGVPALASDCELGSGIGACSVVDGVLRVVALDPNGWATDTAVVTAELSSPHSGAIDVEVVVLTDVDGVDLPFAVDAPVPAGARSGRGSGFPWIVAAVGAGAGVGAGGWWLRRRNRLSRDEPGPTGGEA